MSAVGPKCSNAPPCLCNISTAVGTLPEAIGTQAKLFLDQRDRIQMKVRGLLSAKVGSTEVITHLLTEKLTEKAIT